ncbi:MAG: FIG00461112: hypothetical protein [uncultured Paraburkholderia sp.]|nr:MAG: FIG00461112: hypothetical protein [uncultured Paraburkholderia sp.]CAH2943822.1 MAG: FIG00461112: hypothetical protein [uncultured Paraburkholderia sp.]
MKTAPQTSDGDVQHEPQTQYAQRNQRDPHTNRHPNSMQEASEPLPHETDQDPESQHEDHPCHVGKQAHEDVQSGMKDTDRRGGDEYQQQTQNDAHTNANSGGKLR